ncbi:MAG: hypothetical protein PHY94_03390, partial [Candidatus Omnitrophica bacterium]|nr:hypothetical protein [Candidatus Omnitrophota bacterium]
NQGQRPIIPTRRPGLFGFCIFLLVGTHKSSLAEVLEKGGTSGNVPGCSVTISRRAPGFLSQI